MKRLFIGADPGSDGAVAGVNEDGDIVFTFVYPWITGVGINSALLSKMILKEISQYDEVYCALERVHAIRGAGAKTTFNFGKNYGIIMSILHTIMCKNETENMYSDEEDPLLNPTPLTWQKVFWIEDLIVYDDEGKRLPKQSTEATALSRWPSQSWKETPRSRKNHDGMTDAAGIAYYCRNEVLNGKK